MNSLIPAFIQQQLDRGDTTGTYRAVCLSLDLSGFTTVTEDLMEQGKSGAEELSRLINELFGELVELIYTYRGSITSFAGDAMTSLFPGDDVTFACTAAAAIRDAVKRRKRLETRFGFYRISVRLGLAVGEVRWGIVGTESARTYYFSGSAVDRAVAAQEEATGGSIVIDAALADAVGRLGGRVEAGPEGFSLLPQVGGPSAAEPQRPAAAALKEADLLRMYPREVVDWTGPGEFRRVAVVFLGFRTLPSHDELDRVASRALEACGAFGGYFNLLDYGDKGLLMLALFGAPTAHENDVERAADFALSCAAGFGDQVRAGMTFGTVYAGLVGSGLRATYTALGSTVNLAARLMQKAAWGTLTVPDPVRRSLGARFMLQPAGRLELKGIDRPVAAYTVSAAAASGRERFSGSMVGRDAELAALAERLGQAAAGRYGGVVYVYGEAGMGKSRLVDEALRAVGDRVRVLTAETDAVMRKSLAPVAALLSAYFGISEVSSDREGAFNAAYDRLVRSVRGVSSDAGTRSAELLERYRPFVGVPLGVHPGGSIYDQLDPQSRFENTVYAVTEFLRAQCLISPVIFVVEDIHALDGDSRQLLAYAVRNLVGLPTVFVVTSRYADDGSRPTLHPDDLRDVASITVGPLPRERVSALLASRIGGTVAEETMGIIFEKTQGNPFYVEQFAAYLQDTGRLQSTGGVFSLSGGIQEIPSGINGILAARLDRLPAALKAVTQVASIFGAQFPRIVIRRIMGSPTVGKPMQESAVDDCLTMGERQRLWAAEGEEILAFQSALLRETAYEMQSSERVRRLHRVAAYALEDEVGQIETRFADLAYHFHLGEVVGKSSAYLRKAAEFAAESYKNDQAIELYGRELEVADPHEEIDIRLRIAEVHDVRGDWEKAIDQLNKALDVARTLVRRESETSILVKAGEIYQKRGDYVTAERVLRAAIGVARAIDARQCYGTGLLYLGRTYWSLGKYDPGIKLLETAARVLEALGDENGLALSLYYTGVMYRDKGDYRKADEYYRKSEQVFHRVGNHRLETYPLYDLAVIYLYRGELRAAFASFSQVESVYREMGYKSGLAAVLGNLGVISAFQGKFTEAEAYGAEALKIVREIGEQLAISYAVFNQGLFRYMQGDHETSAATFESALALMRKIGAEGYYGYVQSYASCSLAYLNRFEDALRHARDHLARIASSGSDVENGRTLLGVALVLSRTGGALSGAARALMEEIGGITGLPEEAEAYFKAALDRAAKATYAATLFAAHAQWGSHLLKTGRPADLARAGTLLTRAREIAVRTTMVYELPRIEELLARIEERAGAPA